MRIIRLMSVTSTQEKAKEFIEKGEELVVVAERQTKGYGRFGRSWHSPPGGLWFSLLLFPGSDYHLIPFLVTGSVIEAIEERSGLLLQMKWPNDIVLEGKKLGGILSEKIKDALVVGVGINVNNQDFPKGLENNAISLKSVTNKESDLNELLNLILKKFKESKPNAVIEMLKEKNYLKGKRVLLKMGEREVACEVLDLGKKGELIISTKDEDLIPVFSAEVEKVYDFSH